MIRLWLVLALAVATLAACAPQPTARDSDILILGDSVMAWNGGLVSDTLEKSLGRRVSDRSRSGAALLDPDGISAQYMSGDWDWLVFDGGANDLSLGCGCRECGAVIDRLVTEDGGTGAIPDLVRRARSDGARVIYLGLYRAPERRLFFVGCESAFDEIDRRVGRLSARESGIYFVSAKAGIDPKTRDHFAIDRIHPSREGSRRIGGLIAQAILDAERR